jgi:hypothetical protein
MVNKLKLSCYRHPKSYKGSLVQCRIKFSIGKYEDEVYFDVLPIDACHVLLSRPWQFDKHVQHDGRKNIYFLAKNEMR